MNSPHARVLIVDATSGVDGVLARQLEQQGYTVECATDMALVAQNQLTDPFDLILLDFRRQEVDASPLMDKLKADNPLRHTPVMVLDGASDLADTDRYLGMGVQEYLQEPFSPLLLDYRIDHALEKKRMLDQEFAQRNFLKYERELQIGRDIQQQFMPETLPQPAGYEIAARFHPARQVAGDFYDAFPLSHNRVGLVIADVCDKGVGAALFMTLARSLIRAYSQQHYTLSLLDALSDDQPKSRQPKEPTGRRRTLPSIGTQALKNAVVLTNNYIAKTHESMNMFVTLFFGVLDPATGTLIYINGGHESPAIFGPNGIKARLKPTGPAVGMMADMNFEIKQAQIDPGEILFTYTDGVPDAHDPESALFSEKRVMALLEHPFNSAEELLDRVEGAVLTHMNGADQFDDITMLAVRREAAPEGATTEA